MINRAADNLPPPERLSLLATPRCPYCGKNRGLMEQIGLTGFLIGGGRCSHCRSPLPLRDPVVELGTLILFTFIGTQFGITWTSGGLLLVTALLVLITVIDIEHRLILNVVVLPATLVALMLSPILLGSSLRASVVSSLLGMILGYASIFGIYLLGKLFVKLMARAQNRTIDEVAFGLGDVKLAGFVGALIGFPGVISALVYAILLGGLVSFVVVVFQLMIKRQYALFMAIPYGPFITVAAWLVMMFGVGLGRLFPG